MQAARMGLGGRIGRLAAMTAAGLVWLACAPGWAGEDGAGGGEAPAAAPATTAPLDERAALRAAAQKVMERDQDAIVTIKLVTKTQTVVQGRSFGDSDDTNEIPGTVLSADGLVVTSISMSDPMSLYDMGSVHDGDGGELDYQRKTNITDVKIVLADGKEIPAEFVLRDKDLDLAFLRPKKAGQTFAFVKLVTGLKPGLLDDVISLTRMGTSVNRAPAVGVGQISAVVKKPRTMYVAAGQMGLPVYNAKGEAMGIGAMKVSPSKAGGRWGGRDTTPVVLTSEDVLEVAAQAVKPKDKEEGDKPEKTPAKETPADKDAKVEPPAPAPAARP